MEMDFIEQLESEDRECEKTFTLPDIETYIKVVNRDIEIICYSNKYDDIFNIVKYFTEHGYFINSIEFNILKDKKTKSMTEIDYTYVYKIKKYLDSIHNYTDINFTYNDHFNAPYEDFFGMIECIKWYRSLVLESDLSPVERLTYAYDICKTIHYKISDNKNNDNTLHLIVKTGNILCLGYNELLKEIVFGMDGIILSEFRTREYDASGKKYNHSRGIVKLDDDEYNIHGIYMLDVTYDSIHEEYAEQYGEKYSALSGYRYYLVPIHKYDNYFKNATYPRIFQGKHNAFKEKYLTKTKLDDIVNRVKQNNRLVNKKIITSEVRPLIEGMTISEMYQYLNCERPDVFDFMDIITNVRYSQGYDIINLSNEIVYGIDSLDKDDAVIIEDDILEKKLVL